MAYVKIEFNPLWVTKADTGGMHTIGYYLTDDVSYGGGQRRIDWILDHRYDHISNNRTFMAKYSDKIFLDDLYADDSYNVAISVPTFTMIDLLQQWDEVCKANPEEVTIYYENDKFRIEAKKRTKE